MQMQIDPIQDNAPVSRRTLRGRRNGVLVELASEDVSALVEIQPALTRRRARAAFAAAERRLIHGPPFTAAVHDPDTVTVSLVEAGHIVAQRTVPNADGPDASSGVRQPRRPGPPDDAATTRADPA